MYYCWQGCFSDYITSACMFFQSLHQFYRVLQRLASFVYSCVCLCSFNVSTTGINWNPHTRYKHSRFLRFTRGFTILSFCNVVLALFGLMIIPHMLWRWSQEHRQTLFLIYRMSQSAMKQTNNIAENADANLDFTPETADMEDESRQHQMKNQAVFIHSFIHLCSRCIMIQRCQSPDEWKKFQKNFNDIAKPSFSHIRTVYFVQIIQLIKTVYECDLRVIQDWKSFGIPLTEIA